MTSVLERSKKRGIRWLEQALRVLKSGELLSLSAVLDFSQVESSDVCGWLEL